MPDDVTTEIVMAKLKSLGKKGFILDGFPRTVEQAVRLDQLLKEQKTPINMVLQFNTSEKVIIDRLSGRRMCPNCGANYHIRNIPPKREGICDSCAQALIQRKDDQPETIRKRLQVYRDQTSPLIEFYKQLRKLCDDFCAFWPKINEKFEFLENF